MSELAGLGFSRTAAMDALQQCKGNREKALDRLFALGEAARSSAGGSPGLCCPCCPTSDLPMHMRSGLPRVPVHVETLIFLDCSGKLRALPIRPCFLQSCLLLNPPHAQVCACRHGHGSCPRRGLSGPV